MAKYQKKAPKKRVPQRVISKLATLSEMDNLKLRLERMRREGKVEEVKILERRVIKYDLNNVQRAISDPSNASKVGHLLEVETHLKTLLKKLS